MTSSVTSKPQRRRRAWWLVLAAVALAAAVAAVALAQGGKDDAAGPRPTGSATKTSQPTTSQPTTSAGPPAVKQRQVAEFSGATGTSTKTFVVALNWELRWIAESGSGFTVELLKADGTARGTIVTAGKKTSGSTFVAEKGELMLKVTSTKPWTIKVFSRPIGQ